MQLRRGIAFNSVSEQHPNPYFQLSDKWPQYVQVQRTTGSISGNTISFNVQGFDPNMFLKSKAYIKVTTTIDKSELEEDALGNFISRTTSNYLQDDRIYKKPGMVLHNACTDASIRINSHTLNYKDLRYLTKKLNMSFAGKEINNTYLTTSGGQYEEYNGVYNEFGNIDDRNDESNREEISLTDLGFISGIGNNSVRFISDKNVVTGSDTLGFDLTVAPGPNRWEYDSKTAELIFTANGATAIDIVNTTPITPGMVIVMSAPATTLNVISVSDTSIVLANSTSGDVAATNLTAADTYTTNRETARLQFANSGGGNPVNLAITQIFQIDDIIVLTTGQSFRVIGFSGNDELIVGNINGGNDFNTQEIDRDDAVFRLVHSSFNGDDGRQKSYDNAFRDITIGSSTSTFSFTEPLNFGPFNAFDDYDDTKIKGWSTKMTSLIPYIRQLEINMTFKDIAANSLIYSYGRLNTATGFNNSRKCELIDTGIQSAELVLFWVKPRDEKIMNIPRTVRIQSFNYDHKQFPLPNVGTGDDFLINGAVAINSQTNIYTNQQPSYLLYYGMVDKDSDNYKCRAVNSDFNAGGSQNINITQNSVEAGMHLGDTMFDAELSWLELGFTLGATNNITWTQATGILLFAAGGGVAIDLINTQTLRPLDRIVLITGEQFVVTQILTITTASAIRLNNIGDVALVDLSGADIIFRKTVVDNMLTIRSNVLGGDDIIDRKYNIKELYRLTLKNSVRDFPYSEVKFRGLSNTESMLSSYPSEFYVLLSEDQLNSFYVRKGQLQTSVVMDYKSTLVATDGYSLNKVIETFENSEKVYALHIIYIYDRFYISLSDSGETDSKFDASFY